MLTLQQRHSDRPFNPWRTFGEDKRFLRTILNLVHLESGIKRQRNAADQIRYERLVEALLADIAYNVLLNEPEAIHLTRRNSEMSKKFQRRYRPEFITGKILPTLLDNLRGTGLIEMTKGHRGVKREGLTMPQTRITATDLFIFFLKQSRVSLSQIHAQYEGQEIVVLKGPKDDFFSDADLTDYADTSDTTKYRNEVRAINDWLKVMPISAVDHYNAMSESPIDLRERHLRRYFTRSSFTSGGRLFGGFWQQLSKHGRLTRLRLAGHETVELDFSSIVPRLLYATAGLAIPSSLTEDLYRIPGLERSRAGVKKTFNALLFDTTKRTRLPQDTGSLFHPEELAQGTPAILEAIKTAHGPVKDFFGTGIGHRLMFQESQILVAILMDLAKREAVGLPIHDAILTGQRDARLVADVMLSIFEGMTGKPGKVTTTTHRHLIAA